MERQDEYQVIGDIEEQELESLSDSQIDKLNGKLMINIVFISQLPDSTSKFVPISSIPGIHRFDVLVYNPIDPLIKNKIKNKI